MIYLDCTNGVSSDMLVKALISLGASKEYIDKELSKLSFDSYHRSYVGIKELIEKSNILDKEMILNIYLAIGKAESAVHGEPLDKVHFHEVGREEAIKNIVSICAAVSSLNETSIYCSKIWDGVGQIECSHGLISVPVPAVKEMMKTCNLSFRTCSIETEMVTPSGLGTLIGLGAKTLEDFPEGEILARGVGIGSRNIGQGLEAYIIKEA